MKFFEILSYMQDQDDKLISYIQREIVKYTMNNGGVGSAGCTEGNPFDFDENQKEKKSDGYKVAAEVISAMILGSALAVGGILGLSSYLGMIQDLSVKRGHTYCQELDIPPAQMALVYPPESSFSCAQLEEMILKHR